MIPLDNKGSDNIILREMTLEDIPLGMQLKSLAGWNQLETDWKMLLDAGGDNFIASLDGHDAGTVISIPYQDCFTWIGMVLVDPKAMRKGVGKALLNKSIEIARPKGAIRLDATAEGFELYSRLGFRTEYELVRMVRRSAGSRVKQLNQSNEHCIHIGEDELASITRLDIPIFGADRSGIMRYLHTRNPEYALYRKEKGSIKAYCLGRSGSLYEQIGPIIAEGYAYAADLLEAALDQLESKDVVIDAFADKPDWISLLEASGFAAERSFSRMCLGRLHHPGIREKQFAIAGPEIG
jgi:GNAT superfamily N-acetyltransferase